MNKKIRLYTLDYLRGLAALGIMIYHYLTWTYGSFPINSFMGKWGVYGVSIFYILSGLTLFHVYFKKMAPSYNDLKDFFLKRLFRIYPLLWLTIILTLIPSRIIPGLKVLFINFTGLFGLIKWDGYIGTGVWSIGNELVFYLFFPVFVFLTKKSKPLFYIFAGLLFFISLYFAFFKLDPGQTLDHPTQWTNYVNPLNQVFLFLSGYIMGLYFTNTRVSKLNATVIFILSLAAFIFYRPVGENLSEGINRIVLSTTSFLICFAFYKNTLRFPALIDKALTRLGEASYSVYLLHPIVWIVFRKIISVLSIELPPFLQIISTIIITLIIGYFNYRYFETYFINKGKDFSQKLNTLYKKKDKEGQDYSGITTVLEDK